TVVAYDSQGATAQLPPSHSGANSLTGTAETRPPVTIGGSINPSDGGTTVAQNAVVHISGWAADKEDGAPVARVQVLLDGVAIGNATLGLSRPDVTNYLNSGWALDYIQCYPARRSPDLTVVAYDSQGATAQLPPSHSGANS